MALPRSISGVDFPSSDYFIGPFRDANGIDYFLNRDSGDHTRLEMWKADNGDAVWAEGDSGNAPSESNTLSTVGAKQDGDVVHICYQDTGGVPHYIPYNTSDNASPDTWGSGAAVDSGGATGGVRSVDVGFRSDGDLICAYQTLVENIGGTNYTRLQVRTHEGTAWGDTDIALDDGGTVNYQDVVIIMGASDKAHIVYADITNKDVYHKSFSSANSLSAAEACNDNAAVNNYSLIPGAYLDISGAEVVIVGWKRSSDDHIYTSKITNDGTPAAEADATDNTVLVAGGVVLGCLTKDDNTDTFYLVYADNTTADLYMTADTGSGWDTDTEILDAITANDINANVYQIDSGDTVIGYVYDDAGTVKYNEEVIVAAPTGSEGPLMSGRLLRGGTLVKQGVLVR